MPIEKSSLSQVKEFHETFNHPVNDKPHLGDAVLNVLRVTLLEEEVAELEEALAERNELEVLDALLDIQYVLDGAFLALGFHKVKNKAFEEVHASNMSKLGEDGKPIFREDGKVLKGPNYFKVNLQKFINRLNAPHGEKFERALDESNR